MCSTDRKDCCANSSSDIGRWYLPNGTMISDLMISNSSETFSISLGYQIVGLNFSNNNIPTGQSSGIYHCEMMDDNDMINHLYVGIYLQNKGNQLTCYIKITNLNHAQNNNDVGNINITSLEYNGTSQTIVCRSSGGPATDVRWLKDGVIVSSDGELYEYSQIAINTTTATYENRLTLIEKSSRAAGVYTCHVSNLRGSWNESLAIKGTIQ